MQPVLGWNISCFKHMHVYCPCCWRASLQSQGVDTIACISVNDAFVMDAWGKSVGAGDKVLMLADGNGQFSKALGVELDLTDKGLGVRSRRYALLADDQVGVGGGRDSSLAG